MSVEGITLQEGNQRETDEHHMVSPVCRILNKTSSSSKPKTRVVARGRRAGWRGSRERQVKGSRRPAVERLKSGAPTCNVVTAADNILPYHGHRLGENLNVLTKQKGGGRFEVMMEEFITQMVGESS